MCTIESNAYIFYPVSLQTAVLSAEPREVEPHAHKAVLLFNSTPKLSPPLTLVLGRRMWRGGAATMEPCLVIMPAFSITLYYDCRVAIHPLKSNRTVFRRKVRVPYWDKTGLPLTLLWQCGMRPLLNSSRKIFWAIFTIMKRGSCGCR